MRCKELDILRTDVLLFHYTILFIKEKQVGAVADVQAHLLNGIHEILSFIL